MIEFKDIIHLIKIGRNRLALEKLEERLPSFIEDARIYYLFGLCYKNLGKFKEARTAFEKALSINPNATFVLNQLAVVEFQEGNMYKGNELLSASLKIDPKQEQVFVIHSQKSLDQGAIKEATRFAHQALEIQPKNIYAKNVIILEKIIKHQFKEASELIHLVLAQNPEHVFSLTNLGLLKLYTEQVDESVSIFKETLAKNPESEMLKSGLRTAILSKNQLVHFAYKLFLNVQKSVIAFRATRILSFMTIYLAFVVVCLFYQDAMVSKILIFMLFGYLIYFFPSKIMPQLLNFVLLGDRLGKFLLSSQERILTIGSTFFFSIGISVFINYFFFAGATDNIHLLIVGLLSFFLSGVSFDLFKSIKKGTQRSFLVYLSFLVLFYILYLFFPVLREIIEALLLLALMIYPILVIILVAEDR
ncbi:MAG: tetratricopeptide repeat protein [Bacteroidota bacterium]